MDRCNRSRRLKRRYVHEAEYDERTSFKDDPSLSQIKDALRVATDSYETIIRLAALMDNLAMHHAPAIFMHGGDRSRTEGVRKVLEKDGYLLSRYSSLMRYKNLARDIRRCAGLDVYANLLWGLEPTCPEDVPELDYEAQRELYLSLEGMNFKQIKAKVRSER